MSPAELSNLDGLVCEVMELADDLAARLGFADTGLPCLRGGMVRGIVALQEMCDALQVVRAHLAVHVMDRTPEDPDEIERVARKQCEMVDILTAAYELERKAEAKRDGQMDVYGHSLDSGRAQDATAPRGDHRRNNTRRRFTLD